MPEALSAVLSELPRLRDVLDRAGKRYRGLNEVRGTLKLDPHEAKAVELLGCSLSRRGTVLKLAELDRALRDSSVQAGLAQVLDSLGISTLTNRDAEQRAAERVKRMRLEFAAAPRTERGASLTRRWLDVDAAYVDRLAHGSPARRQAALRVISALDGLPMVEEPLAYFSTRVTGDAHAFDRNRSAGSMLDRAIGACFGVPAEQGLSPRAIRERLLAQAGLLLDDLSSDVLVASITADTPGLREIADTGLPFTIPLYLLMRTGGIAPRSGKRVHVVENPTVFRTLMERALDLGPEIRPALVCGNGNPSLAVQRLLARLSRDGFTVLYSGDYDVRGYRNALWLARGSRISMWRMTPEDHAAALRAAPPGPAADADDLPADIRAMLRQGTAHQESVIDVLWADILAGLDR